MHIRFHFNTHALFKTSRVTSRLSDSEALHELFTLKLVPGYGGIQDLTFYQFQMYQLVSITALKNHSHSKYYFLLDTRANGIDTYECFNRHCDVVLNQHCTKNVFHKYFK